MSRVRFFIGDVRDKERMQRFWITLDEGVDLVFKALRESKGGVKVAEGFEYNSGNNTEWLSVEILREELKKI